MAPAADRKAADDTEGQAAAETDPFADPDPFPFSRRDRGSNQKKKKFLSLSGSR